MSEEPRRVLVVDDSGFMRNLIKQIIAVDPAFTVVEEASDGNTAIVATKNSKPHIIVLDIEMPKMNGIEFMKRLRVFSLARVIVLSKEVKLGSPIVDEVKKLGAFDVIAKPSGAISLDLKAKRGHQLLEALHKAGNLPPPDFQALALRQKGVSLDN